MARQPQGALASRQAPGPFKARRAPGCRAAASAPPRDDALSLEPLTLATKSRAAALRRAMADGLRGLAGTEQRARVAASTGAAAAVPDTAPTGRQG